jgi:hypothetical protein
MEFQRNERIEILSDKPAELWKVSCKTNITNFAILFFCFVADNQEVTTKPTSMMI